MIAEESGSTRTVSYSMVDSVWVQGRSTLRGAAIGAATLGLLLGLGAVSDAQGWDSSEAFGFGFVIGAGAGGVLGAGIGAVTPRWRQRFP